MGMQIIENVTIHPLSSRTGSIILAEYGRGNQLVNMTKIHLDKTPINFPTESEIDYIRQHSNEETIVMDNVGVQIDNSSKRLLLKWLSLMRRK